MTRSKQQGNKEQWRSNIHPKRKAYGERMRAPVVGIKRSRGNPGCYGYCCGEYTGGGRLCTVCHKYGSAVRCCGHWTVPINPRIRVPRANAINRWKEFLRRFPRFAYSEGLRVMTCLYGHQYAAKDKVCPDCAKLK